MEERHNECVKRTARPSVSVNPLVTGAPPLTLLLSLKICLDSHPDSPENAFFLLFSTKFKISARIVKS